MRQENSPSTRLGAAYEAVLDLSFAVLASRGWRCTSADGHHAQSLEAASAHAGVTESVFAHQLTHENPVLRPTGADR